MSKDSPAEIPRAEVCAARVAMLTGVQRSTLLMFVHGLTRDEIAGRVCRDVSTVDVALLRARRTLRARNSIHAAAIATVGGLLAS
jgi:DNA-binding CsgD family transcriptional regulator